MTLAKDMRLLVVEDDQTLLYLVERQLTFLGFPCERASSGSIAVDKAQQERFDLILMDVMMPDVDGLEATVKIRTNQHFASCKSPIVAMTAFAEKQKCLDAGMNDFVLKPVMLKPLREILQKWLNIKLTAAGTHESVASTSESSFRQTHNNLADIDDRIKQLRQRYNL